MLTLELAGNISKMNVTFPTVGILLRRQLSLDSNMMKQLLRQVKSYIDKNHYCAKVNVIDRTKDFFNQPLSAKEILDELESSKKSLRLQSFDNIKKGRFRTALENRN